MISIIGTIPTASLVYTFLGAQTASNSATLDFTSLITTNYDIYVFEIQDLAPITNNVNLLLLTSSNNGSTWDNSSSNYRWVLCQSSSSNSSTTPYVTASSSATSIQISTNIGNGTSLCTCGIVRLYNPLGTVNFKKFESCTATDTFNAQYQNEIGGGARLTASAINAVRFILTSGNISAGIIRMYGISKQ